LDGKAVIAKPRIVVADWSSVVQSGSNERAIAIARIGHKDTEGEHKEIDVPSRRNSRFSSRTPLVLEGRYGETRPQR
jgi:hypothetical protein